MGDEVRRGEAAIAKAHNGIPLSADAAFAAALEYSAFPPCLPERLSRMDDRPAVRYMLNRESTFSVPQITRGVRGAGYAASMGQSRKRANGIPPSADAAFSAALEYSAFPPCLPVRLSRMDDRPAVRHMLNRESAFSVPQIMRGVRGAGYAASRLQS